MFPAWLLIRSASSTTSFWDALNTVSQRETRSHTRIYGERRKINLTNLLTKLVHAMEPFLRR